MALLLTQPKTSETKMPDWLAIKIPDEPKPSLPSAPASAEPDSRRHTVSFERDIAPLLERSCSACHGGDARKGKFSVANRDSILKGGQSGETAVRPGNSAGSKLLHMVTDQVEDLEMPPLAKRAKYPPLTRDEVALLKTWIDEGLAWDTAAAR
jgi:hypothetical protein